MSAWSREAAGSLNLHVNEKRNWNLRFFFILYFHSAVVVWKVSNTRTSLILGDIADCQLVTPLSLVRLLFFLPFFLTHSLILFRSNFWNGIEGFESDLGLNEIRLCTYFFYLFICHAIGIFDKRIISRNKIENVFYQSNLLVVHCTRMFLLLVCRWFYGNSHLWLRLWNVKVPNIAFHPF